MLRRSFHRRARRAGLATVLAVSSFASSQALAQDQAAADALFDSAVKAMKKKDYATACPRFKKSHAIDPGVGTLLNLGRCYTLQGRLTSAWTTYREAAALARRENQADREAHAREQAAQLEPRLPRVKIMVDKTLANLPGLSVQLEGRAVDGVMFGEPLPVDPGEHTVTVKAEGREARSFPVTAKKEGAVVEVVIDSLEMSQGASASEGPKQASQEPPVAEETAPQEPEPVEAPAKSQGGEESASSEGRSIGPYILGGVGVLGAGFGAAMMFVAKGHDNEARGYCVERTEACTQTDVDNQLAALDSANSSATLGYIGFGVGGAALAGAAIWYLLDSGGNSSETGPSMAPLVGPGVFGFSARGAF